MARVHLAIVVTGVLALTAGAAAIATSGGPQQASGGFAGAQRAPVAAPELRLHDQDGRPVRLADLLGRPAVVTFLYTTCEDACPLTAQQIRGALDRLDTDVPVLAISVDPGRDTAARARRFVLRQRLTGRMRFLLGDRAELARQWRAYGIQPQGDGFEHTAHTVLLDGRGRMRVGYPTSRLTPDALAHDVRLLQRGA